MSPKLKFPLSGVLLLVLLVPILAACGGGAASTPIVETVVVTAEPEVVVVTATPSEATGSTETPSDTDTTPTAEQTGQWRTPHPILSKLEVRQAIAHCTDRRALIESVYPFLDDDQKDALLMNTFLPQGHWALAPDDMITIYEFDPEKGKALLEKAGWTAEAEGQPRVNEAGEPLTLKFTTTNAAFRQTWAAVLEQQLLENCGIQIIRTHAPGSWWFGSTTGLARRDFELGAFAWVGQADPGGTTLYACNQIPLPENNWEGQNYMGWCNETASRAVLAANNKLDREQRIEQYHILQREFTADMVSLPLFNRFEAAAASNNLVNFRPNPTTDSILVNVDEWELADGGDTVVLGFTQEPASLWLVVEDAAVANAASSLLKVRAVTSFDYDYQPAALEELPTIENGGTVLTLVEVSAGDTVWSVDGEAVELAEGVEVINSDGEIVAYDGSPITLNQLAVTFEFPPMTWEDGEPLKAADYELAYKIDCSEDSGAISLTVCNSIEDVEFRDNGYTITYLPGAQWAEYFAYTLGTYSNLFTVGAYPSHQVLSDGRKLADVPAKEWSTLPEIAEQPLSYGPYRLVEWQKGQRMVFEANPNYYKGEVAIKTLIIEFFDDTNQAVAQLLTGNVDVLGSETLGAGPELETVLEAAEAGQIQAFPLASPTWEHMDMNLFIR